MGQRLLARQQAAGGSSSSQQGDLFRRDGGSGGPAQRQAGSRCVERDISFISIRGIMGKVSSCVWFRRAGTALSRQQVLGRSGGEVTVVGSLLAHFGIGLLRQVATHMPKCIGPHSIAQGATAAQKACAAPHRQLLVRDVHVRADRSAGL